MGKKPAVLIVSDPLKIPKDYKIHILSQWKEKETTIISALVPSKIKKKLTKDKNILHFEFDNSQLS